MQSDASDKLAHHNAIGNLGARNIRVWTEQCQEHDGAKSH